MATPFPHVQVTHISRMGRRRSQSVTLTNSNLKENTRGQSMRRKEFIALLQNERLKQQSRFNAHDENQELEQQQQKHGGQSKHELFNSSLSKSTATMSMRKHATLSAVTVTTVKKEQSHIKLPTAATTLKSICLQDNETDYEHQTETNQMPQIDSTGSFKNHYSNGLSRYNSNAESSQTSSNPLGTSSTNLMSKSESFDQEFPLNNNNNAQHAQRNNPNEHGTGIINQSVKNNNIHRRRFYKNSSVSFMTAIIGVIIGIIAFAFALAALIVALLARASADAKSTSNSTSSSSSTGSGVLPSSCSAYTTIDDPTRSVSATGYALGCDNTAPFNRTTAVWIRFIGTGGSTLPLATPGINICGSVGTGWYDGTMPSSKGQIVNGTACFTWYDSVCRFSTSISVTNCDSFYIYLLLAPPTCMSRYCTI